MKIVVIGAGGTIGRAVIAKLAPRHEIIEVRHRAGPYKVDLADSASIVQLYRELGRVDAVVCAATSAPRKPLSAMTEADYEKGLKTKLMGQVNVVRHGIEHLNDGGSFTLTSGTLAHQPAPGSSAASLVNAAVEAFARAAALELPRGIRINVVSPGWVAETLAAMGRDPAGGIPVDQVAESYVLSVEGPHQGDVLTAALSA